MLFGSFWKTTIIFVITFLVTEVVFAKNLNVGKIERKKRKNDFTTINSYTFDVALDTSIGLDEDRELTNDLGISASYIYNPQNRFILDLSFTKTYPKTLGPGEHEFFVNAPALNYQYNPEFSYEKFYWKLIWVGVEGTSSELKKRTSRLFTLSTGTKWGIYLLPSVRFEHKIILRKYFDQYENGPEGTNMSHDLINAFDLKYSPIDPLLLGAGISFIHNKTYGKALYLTRVYSIYGEYSLPSSWFLGVKLVSSDDYSMYSREKIELYNRNNSTFIFTIGKSF